MDFQEAYSKGSEAFKQKSFEEARKYLEEAIKLKPNDVYAINRLAMTYKELGDFEAAKSLLGESLDAQKSEGKKEDLYSQYLLGLSRISPVLFALKIKWIPLSVSSGS